MQDLKWKSNWIGPIIWKVTQGTQEEGKSAEHGCTEVTILSNISIKECPPPIHGSVCNGYFEDVQMYISLGFSWSQPEHLKLVKKENGILSWDGALLD